MVIRLLVSEDVVDHHIRFKEANRDLFILEVRCKMYIPQLHVVALWEEIWATKF